MSTARFEDRVTPEYRVAVVDLPADVEYRFSAKGAGSRAIPIAVEPSGQPRWTAEVAAPDPGQHALSAFVGTPIPTGLCIVERGTAFLGDVRRPDSFHVVPTWGAIVSAHELTAESILLLVTSLAITAVGGSGVLWTTERIGFDGLRVDGVEDGWAQGVADPDDEDPPAFQVNLETGEVLGGRFR